MWGVRCSDAPGSWLNWKALNVNNGNQEPVVSTLNKTLTWTDLWTDADLRLDCRPNGVGKTIIVKTSSAPLVYRFALRIPDSHSVTLSNGSLHIRDGQGNIKIKTSPVWAEDAAENPIRCTFSAGASITINGRTIPTYRIVLNADDMSTAVYPVRVDPTTIVEGTTNVFDANLRSGLPSYNYGGNITAIGIYSASSTRRNGVVRCDATQVPASGNTINAVRLIVKDALATTSSSLVAYKILSANDWVEGSGTGTGSESGACCWDYRQYTSASWAGSAGCMTASTDYDSSGVTFTITSGAATTITLTTSWGTDWQTSSNCRGVVLQNTNAGANAPGIHCSESGNTALGSDAANHTVPFFEFDYTAGSGGTVPVFYYNLQTHGIA
jgi:hypothetical protein